jgi:hypothetical protein
MIEETSSSFDPKDSLVEEDVVEDSIVEEEQSPLSEPDFDETSVPDVEMPEEGSGEFEEVSECIDAIAKDESLEKDEELSELVENIHGTVIETPISSIVVPLEQHQENSVDNSNIYDMAQQISNGMLIIVQDIKS